MISSNPTKNTLTKRESTNREFITKAALIGISNLYGIDFVLRIVNKTERVKVSLDNLVIEYTSLFESSFEEQSSQLNIVNKSSRNELKSYEAMQFNAIGDFLKNTYGLQYQLAKSREAKKTIKMLKYKWIDPFNEDGFKMFGEKVIECVNMMEKETLNKKHSLVRLDGNNALIYSLYCECISDRSLLTERGSQLVNSYVSTTTTTDQMTENTQTYQTQQTDQIQPIETQNEIDNTMIPNGMYYTYQNMNENEMNTQETGNYIINYTYDIPQWIVEAQETIVNDNPTETNSSPSC